MNFDDLQSAWNQQRAYDSTVLSDRVLKSIRLGERRLWWIVVTAAIRDAAVALFFVAAVRANLNHEQIPPLYVLLIGAIFTLGMAIILYCSRSLTGDFLAGVGPLGDRIGRDNAGFKFLVRWRNAREVIGCSLAVWMFATEAIDAEQYRLIYWISVALLGLAAGSYLWRSLRIEFQKPKSGGSVIGQLSLSVYYCRAQMRLLGNLWWYLIPAYCAAALNSIAHVLNGRDTWAHVLPSLPAAAIVLCIPWWVNRWLVNSRLRPRTDHLTAVYNGLLSLTGERPASKI